MPRQLMAKYECSRCAREWYVDYKEGESLPTTPTFRMTMTVPNEDPVEVVYGELCGTCSKSVQNYASSIAKKLRGKSPKRSGAKKKPPEGDSSPKEGSANVRPPARSPSTDTSRARSSEA